MLRFKHSDLNLLPNYGGKGGPTKSIPMGLSEAFIFELVFRIFVSSPIVY